ncbi:hypothetical protein [Methyloversatilis sp.]|uniref:hypothetical protein n=1 Tax=Methyloversatilis sp. TaxID=2569862 RepID=UPI00273490A9|nr:hypothetical protein [Methyloversatilis sp.]MDP3457045.1 hypothetical protein [Methyloversatilis sp.]
MPKSLAIVEDFFDERRIERWVKGEVALTRGLEDVLFLWDQGAFKGAIQSYRTGPAGSRLFQGLGESVESQAFMTATESDWDELSRLGEPRGFSDNVADRLAVLCAGSAREAEEDPKHVMRYVTVAVSWFRYALLTHHSLNYLVCHVDEAMRRLRLVSREVIVSNKGNLCYPVSPDMLGNYIVAMTVGSPRFRKNFKYDERSGELPGWDEVSAEIAPFKNDHESQSVITMRSERDSLFTKKYLKKRI